MIEQERGNPYLPESQGRTPTKQRKITDILHRILKPKEFEEIKDTLACLDQEEDLTLQQKGTLVKLIVWAGDPTSKKSVAQQLRINQEDMFFQRESVQKIPHLEALYKELIKKAPEESIIDRLKKGPKTMPPVQLATEFLSSRYTLARYRVNLIRAGIVEKLHQGGKKPLPRTKELDNLVAEARKANPKISNKELRKLATEELDMEVTKSMINAALFHVVHTRDDVPKKQERKAKQTWSTTKEAGKVTEKNILNVARHDQIAHPGKPPRLQIIADKLTLSVSYVRRVLKKHKIIPNKPRSKQIV